MLKNNEIINKIFCKFEYKGFNIFKKNGIVYYDCKNQNKKVWTYSDKLCAYDCHKFNNTPIPIPINYDKISDKYQILFPYVFCSPNCALSYIGEHQVHSVELTKIMFINMMIKIFGITSKIYPARPRYCLKIFNEMGDDINKFRSNHILVNLKVESKLKNVGIKFIPPNEKLNQVEHMNDNQQNINKGFFDVFIDKCLKNNKIVNRKKNTIQNLNKFLK
jgi:hypothetical protein